MSDLTENEVVDRLKTSLREAIQASRDLAVVSRKGPNYTKLREHLRLIEGCCRQLAAFRGDATWLPIASAMAECHQKAGGWLRGYKHAVTKVHIATAPGHINQLFLMLARNLIGIYEGVDHKVTAATKARGPILFDAPAETRRVGRPALTAPKPKLILPPRFASGASSG